MNDVGLEVWGDLACFTRPEMKVERFSYPIITPSAARGIFDAIYWKRTQNFRWEISRVETLNAPSYIALRRNEVKDKISASKVAGWMKGDAEIEPLFADATKDMTGSDQKGRTQRQTMALKNVRFRIFAHPVAYKGQASPEIIPQFKRRADRGQCFYQPCFGCREFPAYFKLIDDETETVPMAINLDIGWMLYDVFDLSQPQLSTSPARISMFKTSVQNGVMVVPPYNSEQVIKPAAASC